jgi:hypothetical protein
MAETATIRVRVLRKDLPSDLQTELTAVKDRMNFNGFDFRGRCFYYTEVENDPDDWDSGYFTILELDEDLPDFLDGVPVSCTARFPKFTTDVGNLDISAHGMVRDDPEEPLYVSLSGHSNDLAILRHMAKAMVDAIETLPQPAALEG